MSDERVSRRGVGQGKTKLSDDIDDRLRLLEMKTDNLATKEDLAKSEQAHIKEIGDLNTNLVQTLGDFKTGLTKDLGDFKAGIEKGLGDFKADTCKEMGTAKTWFLERAIGISIVLLGLILGFLKWMMPATPG